MDYILIRNMNEGEVVETNTNSIVYKSEYSKCLEYQRRLNFGGGFAGFTPSFFLERIEIGDSYDRTD